MENWFSCVECQNDYKEEELSNECEIDNIVNLKCPNCGGMRFEIYYERDIKLNFCKVSKD